ncbi:MAG: hypothetical protein WBQ24_03820, partial [Xanthobacteraceae bacterium]
GRMKMPATTSVAKAFAQLLKVHIFVSSPACLLFFAACLHFQITSLLLGRPLLQPCCYPDAASQEFKRYVPRNFALRLL